MQKHPRGLYVLFFTEMWERFSYYGMRGLLVLYLVAKINEGGMGWTEVRALTLYGTYTMFVYLMSVPGGILADKFIGQKKAVMIGGFLLVLGHGIMAIPGVMPFYIALILIVLGVGALKANISTMVGALYKPGDVRRDQGFTIFYMGINVGALLAALVVGYIGQKIDWHLGFGLAGIGMLLGQVVYIAGQKHLKGIGERPVKEKRADIGIANGGNMFKRVINTSFGLFFFLAGLGGGALLIAKGEWLFGLFMPVVGYLIGAGSLVYKNELTRIERDRVVVLLVSFLIVIVFWGAFEQAGGLMNLFTEKQVNKNIFGDFHAEAAQFQFLNPFFIILFGSFVADFWVRQRKKGREEFSVFKMAVGNIIMGLGFILLVGATIQASWQGVASYWWIVGAFLLHTIGELCASPVALSFITKLAPVKYVSILMGLFFAMTGLGNKLAGEVGKSAAVFGEQAVFAGIGIFSVIFGLILILFLPKLKRLSHGAEEIEK